MNVKSAFSNAARYWSPPLRAVRAPISCGAGVLLFGYGVAARADADIAIDTPLAIGIESRRKIISSPLLLRSDRKELPRPDFL
jgi:hypothetical protein